jgi:hypothetical protein
VSVVGSRTPQPERKQQQPAPRALAIHNALQLMMNRSTMLKSASRRTSLLSSFSRVTALNYCIQDARLLATHAQANAWPKVLLQPAHYPQPKEHVQNPDFGEFTSNSGSPQPQRPRKPSREDNLANFGKTLETITAHLPTLLQEGHLPTEILSANIALELLPATMRSVGPIPLPVALQVPFPEIRGQSAYLTTSRIGCWCVNLLFGASTSHASSTASSTTDASLSPLSLVIDNQKLLRAEACASGHESTSTSSSHSLSEMLNQRLEPTKHKLIVRFRLVATSSPGSQQKTLTTGLFHFHFDENGKISRHILEVLEQKHSQAGQLLRSWSKVWWSAAVRAAKKSALGKKEPALGWACAGEQSSRPDRSRSK